jgi:hypothetical protein
MTFVASAEKLCGKLAIDNKTKLARNSSRKLFLIEVSFASGAADCHNDCVESIEATNSCQASGEAKSSVIS